MDSNCCQCLLMVLMTIISLTSCRPRTKLGVHLFTQENFLLEDLKRGELNVSHRRRMKLFSPKSKGYLQIMEKKVNAKGESTSKYVDLIIESVGFNVIRIKGEYSQNYVCFNPRNSKLITKKNGNDIDCVFTERIGEKTKRTIFTSYAHKTWNIGIKNNGKPRLGDRPNKTSTHNNTYEFTPMRGRRKI